MRYRPLPGGLSAGRVLLAMVLALVLLALPGRPALAATCTWTPVNDQWGDVANWDGCGGNIPQSGDAVILPADAPIRTISLPFSTGGPGGLALTVLGMDYRIEAVGTQQIQVISLTLPAGHLVLADIQLIAPGPLVITTGPGARVTTFELEAADTLTKTGPGTLEVEENTVVGGLTTVMQGVLLTSGHSGLGLTVLDGAAVRTSRPAALLTELTLNGAGPDGTGALRVNSVGLSVLPITLQTDTVIGLMGSSLLAHYGEILGPGSLRKVGDGTLALVDPIGLPVPQPAPLAVPVQIDAGLVLATRSTPTFAAPVTVGTAGTAAGLVVSAPDQFTGLPGLVVGSTGTFLAEASQAPGALSGAGTVVAGEGATLEVALPGSGTFSGSMTGTGRVRWTGSGSWTLSGLMAVPDFQIEAGEVTLPGTAFGAQEVHAGAVLRGTGRAGSLVVRPGGRLVPGTPGVPGTLTVDSLVLQDGAILEVQAEAAPASGRVVASGTATLGGAVQFLGLAGFGPGTYRPVEAAAAVLGPASAVTVPAPFTARASLVDGVLVVEVEGGDPAPAGGASFLPVLFQRWAEGW